MFRGWDSLNPHHHVRDQQEEWERRMLLRIRYQGPLLVNHEAHQDSKFLRLDDWTSSLLLFDYHDPTTRRTGIKLVNLEDSSAGVRNNRPAEVSNYTRANQTTKQRISDVQWYPFDSGLFSTCHAKGNVRIWDTEQLLQVKTFDLQQHQQPTSCFQLAMSPVPSSHSALLAVACKHGEIRMIDLFSQNYAQSVQAPDAGGASGGGDISAVAWSPRDANILVGADMSGRVLIWDIRRSNMMLNTLDEWNQDLTFSNSSSSADGGAHEAASHKRMRRFAHSSVVQRITFIEHGRAMLTCDAQGVMRVWRETGTDGQFRHTHVTFTNLEAASSDAVGVSQDTKLVFVGDGEYVKCFNSSRGGKALSTLAGHARRVRAVCVRDRHQQVYTLADDGFIVRWQDDVARGGGGGETAAAPGIQQLAMEEEEEADEDNWSD